MLRGIAAVGVLLCHYTSACHRQGQLAWEFRLGSYGPHLFFVISGFVIFMTLQRCQRSPDFLFSRFSRLYPVYWFSVCFSVVMMLIQPTVFEGPPTVQQLIGNLTMCQTWLGISNIEVSYWTLAVEFKFYFLMFLLLWMRKLRLIEFVLVVWLSAVAVFRLIDDVCSVPHALGTPLILDYAHLFAAGIMFFRLHQFGNHWLRHLVILLAIPFQYWAEGSEAAIVVAFILAIFYLFVRGHLSWIVVRPLSFLGDISYALYLVHGALGVATIHCLNSVSAPVWLLVLAPLLLSIAVGIVVTRYVEKPTLKALRGWYGQRTPAEMHHPQHVSTVSSLRTP